MIILDTNQIRGVGFPYSATFAMLETIAASRGHRLAICEMTLIEYLASQRHDAEEAVKSIAGAMRSLTRMAPSLPALTNIPDPTEVIRQCRALLEEKMVVLPTPLGAEAEALRREAERRRPAAVAWERDGGRGARDVVIWLTVLSALGTNSGSEVLLVSADGDFGNNNSLHDELVNELLEQGTPELGFCSGIDALLDGLADKSEVPSDVYALLAESEAVRDAAKELLDSWGFSLLYSRASSTVFAHVDWPAAFLHGTHGLKPAATKNASAYTVADQTWLSVECTWHADYELPRLAPAGSMFQRPSAIIPITAQMTLLANMTDGALHAVTVVNCRPPQLDLTMVG